MCLITDNHLRQLQVLVINHYGMSIVTLTDRRPVTI